MMRWTAPDSRTVFGGHVNPKTSNFRGKFNDKERANGLAKDKQDCTTRRKLDQRSRLFVADRLANVPSIIEHLNFRAS
jgi:hypothetical protein